MAYVTVQEVAAELDIRDGVDDPMLDRALKAAQRDVDRYCGWGDDGFNQTAASATARVFEPDDPYLLTLVGGFWTTTSLTIKSDEGDDGTYEVTWTTSDYELQPLNNHSRGVDNFPYYRIKAIGDYAFPVPSGRTSRSATVEITAKWGWENTPNDVATALILRTGQLFARRATADGINPITGFRAGGRDRDWEILLMDYRHPRKQIGLG